MIDQAMITYNNFSRIYTVSDIDFMDGHVFEYFCAYILEKDGFENVTVTKGSGDQGVDVLAQKNGIRYAIQCKNYATPLSNTPVQEVFAGKTHYNCHVGVVMTNSTFTPGAIALAQSTGVLTWDRTELQQLISNANPRQPVKVVVKKKCGEPVEYRNSQRVQNGQQQGYAVQNNIIPNGRLRKGMKIWAIVCFVLALLYIWITIIIEPFVIAGTAFFGLLGVMFLLLALTPKESEFLLGREKGIRKSSFVWICVSVAFVSFGVIASLLQQTK